MKLRILEICKEKGMTQKELSVLVGMSEVGISKSINGNPTKETLEKIANVLNVPISELFERQQPYFSLCPHCGGKIELKKQE